MQGITNDLALVDSTLSKDDLILHILASLSPECYEVTTDIRVRDTLISFA